jgi:phosphate transport system substrate-binding protein
MRRVMVLAVGAALLLGACSSNDKGSSGGGEKITATLAGSGSTFQKSFDEAVIQAFKSVQPNITITYSGGGSGKGKTDLAAGVDQWAGTDSLVKPEDASKYTKGLLYWPTVAAPITLSYNLSGVTQLILDAKTVAKIYQREIKMWDDAAIKALNPGVTLPATKITPVHRSDASGTNKNFTKWLASAAGSAFKLTAGDTTNWPSDELAGAGNSGVATAIKGTAGAVGYVDFSDAKASGFTFASIVNKAGKAVAPSIDGAAAALSQTTPNADLTYDPLNAAGDTTYPIATPTWIITQKTYTDANVVKALKAFLTYIYGQGQSIAKTVDYAQLPNSFVSQAKAQLDQLTTA